MRIETAIGLACVITLAFYSPAINATPRHERSLFDLEAKNKANAEGNVIDEILMEQKFADDFLSAFQGRRFYNWHSNEKTKKSYGEFLNFLFNTTVFLKLL